jgi:hypothetical protein
MYDDFIISYPNNLTREFCEKIIEKYEQHKQEQHVGVTAQGINLSVKKTMDLFISDKPSWKKEDTILHMALNSALRDYYNTIPKQYDFHNTYNKNIQDKGYQIQKYNKNEGFYIWHNDFSVLEDASYRILTFLWYLNDVNEGGETEFISGVKIKPECGKLVIFPSTWGARHRGVMPISNDKYIITGWIYTRIQYDEMKKVIQENKKRYSETIVEEETDAHKRVKL